MLPKKIQPLLLWETYLYDTYIYQKFHDMNGFVKLRAVSKLSTFFIYILYNNPSYHAQPHSMIVNSYFSRQVYEKLQAIGVPVPRYAVLRRDENGVCDDPDFHESEDTIRVHGKVFNKPFVEKPLSAEDHNVYIYFPSQAGGGCQQLFRKIGSLSSRYCDQSQVRKTGSYIYENFMPTEGSDVKVGTSSFWIHASLCSTPVSTPQFRVSTIRLHQPR
jgi:hypothetical protein